MAHMRAGIMDLLTRKDELAAVIAHEMAHVLARHSAESMTAAAVTLPLRIAAALMLDSGTGMFDAMHTVLVALPASRAAETEADAIGMHLAARACFQPSGMISMLTVRDPPLPSATPVWYFETVLALPWPKSLYRVLWNAMACFWLPCVVGVVWCSTIQSPKSL